MMLKSWTECTFHWPPASLGSCVTVGDRFPGKLMGWFRLNLETWILFFAEDMSKKRSNAVIYCLV